jgi:hypothetical protein
MKLVVVTRLLALTNGGGRRLWAVSHWKGELYPGSEALQLELV